MNLSSSVLALVDPAAHFDSLKDLLNRVYLLDTDLGDQGFSVTFVGFLGDLVNKSNTVLKKSFKDLV
jgi:hypothetical protein